jgi:hypothetical protein
LNGGSLLGGESSPTFGRLVVTCDWVGSRREQSVRDLPVHIDPCGVFRVGMIRSNFAQNLDQKLGTWEKKTLEKRWIEEKRTRLNKFSLVTSAGEWNSSSLSHLAMRRSHRSFQIKKADSDTKIRKNRAFPCNGRPVASLNLTSPDPVINP